jgi:hypothetical protein
MRAWSIGTCPAAVVSGRDCARRCRAQGIFNPLADLQLIGISMGCGSAIGVLLLRR